MIQTICKCCGHEIINMNYSGGALKCIECGATFIMPKPGDSFDKVRGLLSTGVKQLDDKKFDDAYTTFSEAASLGADPLPLFCKALARAHVCYVRDTADGKKTLKPVYVGGGTPIKECEDYIAALEAAEDKQQYEELAAAVESAQTAAGAAKSSAKKYMTDDEMRRSAIKKRGTLIAVFAGLAVLEFVYLLFHMFAVTGMEPFSTFWSNTFALNDGKTHNMLGNIYVIMLAFGTLFTTIMFLCVGAKHGYVDKQIGIGGLDIVIIIANAFIPAIPIALGAFIYYVLAYREYFGRFINLLLGSTIVNAVLEVVMLIIAVAML